MRLVKIGIGNVNSTVGALQRQYRPMIAQARQMAAEQVTVGIFPEQVIGGYPPEDLIQWQALRRPAMGRAGALRRRDSRAADGLDGLRGRVSPTRDCATTARRSLPAGRSTGLVPKEKAADLQHLLRRPHLFARGSAELEDELHGVPFGDFIFRIRFRHHGGRGL